MLLQKYDIYDNFNLILFFPQHVVAVPVLMEDGAGETTSANAHPDSKAVAVKLGKFTSQIT